METFIEKYEMPLSVCDEIIDLYQKNESNAIDGCISSDQKVDTNTKVSKEIRIEVDEQKYIQQYYTNLYAMTKMYLKKHIPTDAGKYGPLSILEGTNIQKYPIGGGFKKLHSERMEFETRSRELVFMTYLTNTPNAGTYFPNQNVTTECIKGDTIIWPAGFTHLHRGIISDTHEKMIITGWINFKKSNK